MTSFLICLGVALTGVLCGLGIGRRQVSSPPPVRVTRIAVHGDPGRAKSRWYQVCLSDGREYRTGLKSEWREWPSLEEPETPLALWLYEQVKGYDRWTEWYPEAPPVPDEELPPWP